MRDDDDTAPSLERQLARLRVERDELLAENASLRGQLMVERASASHAPWQPPLDSRPVENPNRGSGRLVGGFWWNQAAGLLDCSDGLRRLLGLEPHLMISGATALSMIVPEDRETTRAAVARLRSGQERERLELTAIASDGRSHRLELRVAAIRDDDGTFRALAGVCSHARRYGGVDGAGSDAA